MALPFRSRDLIDIKQDGDSKRALRDVNAAADEILPVILTTSPRLKGVEETDQIPPGQDEANAIFRPTFSRSSGALVTLTHAFPRPETTLRTSLRPTGPLRSNSASRSLAPGTTGRPLLGPVGSQTGRPSLGSPGSRSQSPPVNSSLQSSSLVSVAPRPPTSTNESGLVPVLPAPAAATMGTLAGALPDQATAQPSVTATPSRGGLDAGGIVGFIMLALVGIAAIIGGYVFIKKCASKRNDNDNRSGPSSINGPFSDNDEAPMVMARSYPDIAARLGAIAARAEKGDHGSTTVPRQTPSSQDDRLERGFPFAENRSPISSPSEEVPMAMARSYPEIAAQLGAIAAWAERGEQPGPTTVSQAPSAPDENNRERRKGFPFAESGDSLPTAQRRPLETAYFAPPEDRREWLAVSPGFGSSVPGRDPPGSFNTDRSSGYVVDLDSSLIPNSVTVKRMPRM